MTSEPLPAEILEGDTQTPVLLSLQLQLAEQLAPWSWRSSLKGVRQKLESGSDLETACDQGLKRAPGELKNLMAAALQVPDPLELLVESLRLREEVRQGWRELVAVLIYPCVLFVIAVIVAFAFSSVMKNMVYFDWIEEFGLSGAEFVTTNLTDQHQAILGLALMTVWTVVILLSVYLIGPRWGTVAVMGGMFVIGKPIRWVCLQEMLGRLHLFISQGLSPTDAADAAAKSFIHSRHEVVARAIAERIRRGMPLGESFARSSLADGICRPSLYLLDTRQEDMHLALRETVGLLGKLTVQRCRTLSGILPIFALAIIGTVLWSTLCAYFYGLMPLMTMITSLI